MKVERTLCSAVTLSMKCCDPEKKKEIVGVVMIAKVDTRGIFISQFPFGTWNKPPSRIYPTDETWFLWWYFGSVTQSYPTLFGPMDCRSPGSSVRGIFQARTLKWVTISYRGSSWLKNGI